MFGGIGVQEILVVLIVGLLVFGATRLPKIARSLGLGIKEFKKTIKSVEDDEALLWSKPTIPAAPGGWIRAARTTSRRAAVHPATTAAAAASAGAAQA